jgi:putative flippase GtrA
MVLRFLRFNVVGAAGVVVQLALLALLVDVLKVHYLVATAIATEVSVLHNFYWHVRWTWAAELPASAHRHIFFRCVAFHAGNGLVSMLGSLALMPALVGGLGVHYLLANVAAIGCTGILNFALGDRVIFTNGRGGAR